MGHEEVTKGGWLAHWVRRATHVLMLFVPWVYYRFSIPENILWLFIAIILLAEIVRLGFGLQVFGQRTHEREGVSSFAWGSISLLIVLLLAPRAYAYPIVAGCALVDPLLGELRGTRLPASIIFCVGFVAATLIWGLAFYYFGIPWWWVCIMPLITIAVEWPNFVWIDDNAMMQLIPLVFVIFLL